MDPIRRATVIYGAFAAMLKEIKDTEGSAHPYVGSFGPLVDAGTSELSEATAAAFNNEPLPEVLGPQVSDELFERIETTGFRCVLLAARREEHGPNHADVIRWAGPVRSSIDELAVELLALLTQPGDVGEASE
jgi:hypothetical protein